MNPSPMLQIQLPRPPCSTQATLSSIIPIQKSYEVVLIPQQTPFYRVSVCWPEKSCYPDAARWAPSAVAGPTEFGLRDFTSGDCRNKKENIKYTIYAVDNTIWEDDPYSTLSSKTKEDCQELGLFERLLLYHARTYKRILDKGNVELSKGEKATNERPDELKRGDVPNQSNVTCTRVAIEEIAHEHINHLIAEMWKKMNKDQRPSGYYNGYTPSLEEYMNNALISSSGAVIQVYLFSIGGEITNEAIECPKSYQNLVTLDELERGDVPKSIQCYMHESGVSEEVAREHIKQLIGETWKKMNKDRVSSGFPQPFTRYPKACTSMEMDMVFQTERPRSEFCHCLLNLFLL
ncbi:hypothetical protein HHK36_004215 [Tetracentron sinense]|uniref:Terpene synthase metal-binding domain-containing protein n=1 Tax=Tetracentron sinense TaxID=13715 RepID=A0A834ZSG7_TETSI|nr:hypothetical protein HHK36_004215 [Tetracentron sinense]